MPGSGSANSLESGSNPDPLEQNREELLIISWYRRIYSSATHQDATTVEGL
jgi:hypothetical protein